MSCLGSTGFIAVSLAFVINTVSFRVLMPIPENMFGHGLGWCPCVLSCQRTPDKRLPSHRLCRDFANSLSRFSGPRILLDHCLLSKPTVRLLREGFVRTGPNIGSDASVSLSKHSQVKSNVIIVFVRLLVPDVKLFQIQLSRTWHATADFLK